MTPKPGVRGALIGRREFGGFMSRRCLFVGVFNALGGGASGADRRRRDRGLLPDRRRRNNALKTKK